MQSNDQHFVHPALMSFGDECCATLARLTAYVGALALFAITGLHAWQRLQVDLVGDPAGQPGFTLAERPRPAFAVNSPDLPEKSESYEIFRHPEGGRKDVVHLGPPGGKPVAGLEIYRPGGEFDPSEPRTFDLVAQMTGGNARGLEAHGVITGKFGNIALFRRPGRSDRANSCLGFIKHFDDPPLQISGWSCQGTTPAARRAAIRCMLDRLTLLASGNEPRLAELFARAELKRADCAVPNAAPGDWVTAPENPRLRGGV